MEASKMKKLVIIALLCAFSALPVMAEPVLMPDVLTTLYGTQTFTEVIVDDLWKDLNGGVTVTAKGKWAGYTHNFGIAYYTDDNYTSAMTFNPNGGGSNANWDPGDSDSFDLDNSKTWAFTLTTSAGDTWYSDVSQNADGLDHMRTFRMNGKLDANGHQRYVVAWDDQYGGGDRDFQDNISEVSGAQPVPVPGALLLGMIGLGVAGARLRKKRA
jgi:hypothetical protein